MQASTSESHENGGDGNGSREKTEEHAVPFHKLFAFADSFDKLLMIVGSIGAIGNGVSMPLMTVLFGELVDSFGQNQTNNVVSVVSKVIHLSLFSHLSLFLDLLCSNCILGSIEVCVFSFGVWRCGVSA